MIRCEVLAFTVGTSVANAAGTFLTGQPVVGEITEIRLPGTHMGSTADYTITRQADGGTVLSATAYAAPWTNHPAAVLNDGTATAGTATIAGIPCADYLQLVVGSGVASASGTLFIHYRGPR